MTSPSPLPPDVQRRLHQAETYKLKGDGLLHESRTDQAVAAYRSALALLPDYLPAENNLAVAYLALDKYDEAQRILQRSLMRRRGLSDAQRAAFQPEPLPPGRIPVAYATPFKLKDRIDQLRYIIDQGRIPPTFNGLVDRYRHLLIQIGAQRDNAIARPLTQAQLASFGGYYDRILNFAEPPALTDSSLGAANDYAALEAAFAKDRLVYFDDFLSEDALAGLQTFLRESTVFFHHSPAGFIGSYMPDGFCCKLIFQIAAELRQRLPNVLADCPLSNIWAYRYDQASDGVRPHFDDGTVTVNFWITPDSANLGTGGPGGLVMYDKDTPADWDWSVNVYKDDPAVQANMAAYLEGAKETAIPYKCNRAVLFKSTLLHKSEPFEFREGFENRRVNITLLFAKRGSRPVGES